MMALSGVRSSWLMVARKRLLAAFARSASARASSSACSCSLRSVMSRITATTSRSLADAAFARLIERPAAHLDPDELRRPRRRRIGRIAADAELDRAGFAERGRVGERREIGRAVGDMHAVEQAVAEQVAAPCAPNSGSAAGETNSTAPLRPWRVMTSVMLRASSR